MRRFSACGRSCVRLVETGMRRGSRRGPLHQFLTGATMGDAITSHALVIRRWLEEAGYASDIYAQYVNDSVRPPVRPLSAYRRSRRERYALYHHSIGSDVPQFLQQHGPRLILVHHNVTPARFFDRLDPAWAQRSTLGLQQLRLLRKSTDLALAVSGFNEQDLHAAGYETTGVLPLTLSQEEYDLPDNEALAEKLGNSGPSLLFVGRLAPNKKQEDLVKLLYCYHRLQPGAQLTLVGDRWDVGYDRWIERLSAELGLADNVTLTGKVSQQDLVTAYRHADLYVSMSEHEGFGKPLIESMYLGLPVLAYAATGIPSTLGNAGVLFHEKRFERLAELVDILVKEEALRRRLIDRQRKRAADFLEPQVRQRFHAYLEQVGL